MSTTGDAENNAAPSTDELAIAVAATATHASRLRWWREVFYIGTFYIIYTFIRNQFGSAQFDTLQAYNNAQTIIDIESVFGLYHEATIQSWFLGWDLFIQFWNVFYGTFHFAITIGVLLWLFARHRGFYALWRNTLAFTTGLALIGFSLFPLMPPRLLCDCEWGAADADPAFVEADHPYVDTLSEYGGLWSFDRGTMARVSNQYAAMPSLHFAWSTWCALALWSRVRHGRTRFLAAAYPAATLFAIVITANHFWLDAVGGAVVLTIGYQLGAWVARWNERRIGRDLVAGQSQPASA